MKKLLIYLYAIALCFFTSCDKEERSFEEVDNPQTPTILEISQNALSVPKNGGENTINITCDGKWSITNNEEWCSIDSKAGIGNVKIRITTNANSTENTRTAEILIHGGSLSQKLTITQEPSRITPQPETSLKIHVENEGTLSELLGTNKNIIENLTLTGKLNGSDIKAIREMEKLSKLDLVDVLIISGGDWYSYKTWLSTSGTSYYEYLYTQDDKVSLWMFKDLKLKSISLPKSITAVGEYAFGYCSLLETIAMSDNLTEIGAHAFDGCASLKNIVIPNNVEKIGDFAFINNGSLTSIVIPDNVKALGNSIFWNCSSLTDITLPNNITSIGQKSFAYCSSLKAITIPSEISFIGEFAFNPCSNLKEIHIKAINPPIANLAFKDHSEKILFVPKGTLDSYKKSEEWKNFKDIREE